MKSILTILLTILTITLFGQGAIKPYSVSATAWIKAPTLILDADSAKTKELGDTLLTTEKWRILASSIKSGYDSSRLNLVNGYVYSYIGGEISDSFSLDGRYKLITDSSYNSMYAIVPITNTAVSVPFTSEFDTASYFLYIYAWYNDTVDGDVIQVSNEISNIVKATTGFTCDVGVATGWLTYLAVDSMALTPVAGIIETDPFYKIDSLALNRSMRAFVRDSSKYVMFKDTTGNEDFTSRKRHTNDLALKQNLLVNSAGLAGAISDETGGLKLVFSNEPTFTSKITVNGNVIINTNGTSALLSTKKANNTDGFNMFFGGGGQSVTHDGVSPLSGSYNTAIGFGSLQYNTTGAYNTANGLNALYSNTTGSYNTANGFGSLYLNTTGTYNTANGLGSLRSNTTGTYNTANGVNALYSNTTGQQNTANGVAALYSNTTGQQNTANGYSSLRLNTTGSYNTVNGANALYSNTTGTYNTANGVNSGRWITGFITANTTPDYCVFIGDSTAAKADNDQNEIVIGHSAVGNGSNTATYGNSKITNHVFTAGNLGVAGEIIKGSEVSKVPGVMFTQTADKTIANTTTETSLLTTGVGTLTTPANCMIVGKTFRIKLSGYISANNGVQSTLKIKIGSVELVSSLGTMPKALSAVEWQGEFTFTCRTTGSTGTVIGQGSTIIYDGTAITTSYVRPLLMTATATVNTTVSNTMDATYTWGTADAGNTITCTNATLEILN